MSVLFNYGAKNGLWTVIHAVVVLCRIYTKFLVPIRNYINGHPTLTSPQKAQIIDWLDAAMDVCYLLQSQVQINYEPRA